MSTTQDIEFLKKLINTRKRLIGWGVSKNDLTPEELDRMLEKLDRIVARQALCRFVGDHYVRLKLVPHCKHVGSLERIDGIYNESFQYTGI
jgi:hypothetical protein